MRGRLLQEANEIVLALHDLVEQVLGGEDVHGRHKLLPAGGAPGQLNNALLRLTALLEMVGAEDGRVELEVGHIERDTSLHTVEARDDQIDHL